MDVPPTPPSSAKAPETFLTQWAGLTELVEEAIHIWDPKEADDADLIDIDAMPALRIPTSSNARTPSGPNATSSAQNATTVDDSYDDYLDEGDVSFSLSTVQEA